MPPFNDIRKKLVKTLLQLPVMAEFAGRSSLLQGLPPAPLNRNAGFAQLDLNNIVDGLNQLGRLDDQGGIRPLIVVVDNALDYVPAGGEIGHELTEVKRTLSEYYGGDRQSPVAAVQKDLEALVFGRQRDNRLAFSFLEGARRTARSVTRLSVPRVFDGVLAPGVGYGTGWLIAPGIVITNHHVIDNRDIAGGEAHAAPADFQAQAAGIEALFDYYQEVGGAPVKCSGAQLLASSQQFDYALLQLAEPAKVADRKLLPIVAQQPALARGARMNLAQHSRGGALQFAIRNNFFVRMGDSPELLRYQTDSEPGSSGSPVCTDGWQVVGLHHASTTVPKEQVPQEVVDGQPVTVTILNEAIAIHSVLNDLPAAVKQQVKEAQMLP